MKFKKCFLECVKWCEDRIFYKQPTHMKTLREIALLKLSKIESTTLEQSKKTASDLVKPVFVKTSMPGADDKQSSMPDFLKTSWSKILEDPKSNQAAISSVFKALYLNSYDDHFLSCFNIDPITSQNILMEQKSTLIPLQVSIIFGAFKTTKSMEETAGILRNSLGDGFTIITINGEKTSNKDAEEMAQKECLIAKREGKRLIFLSYQMASRSFSVSEIDTVILAYDKGDLGGTSQKVSRCLTPGNTINGDKKTHGLIISLSLDDNRTELDPIDQYFIDQAKKSKEIEKGLQPAVRRLSKAFNIFHSTVFGIDSIDDKTFVEGLFSGGKMEKIFPSFINNKSIDNVIKNLDFDLSSSSIFNVANLKGDKKEINENKKTVDISKVKKYHRIQIRYKILITMISE
jgi:hypothetical protein